MKKRSYTAQGLAYLEVSVVYTVCILLLCLVLFASGQSSAKFLPTCRKECLDLAQSVVSFNQVCSGLFVKIHLMLFLLEQKLWQSSWSVDTLHVGGMCWSSAGGACCICSQAYLPKNSSTIKAQGQDLV